MTDLTPLKALLVEALTHSLTSETIDHIGVYGTNIFFEGPSAMFTSVTFDADRLATTIHDHFLDHDRVRAAMTQTLYDRRDHYERNGDQGDELDHIASLFADHLIASLAGGPQ